MIIEIIRWPVSVIPLTTNGNVYRVDSVEFSITIKSGVGKVKVSQAGGISRPPFCVRATPFDMLRGVGPQKKFVCGDPRRKTQGGLRKKYGGVKYAGRMGVHMRG